MVLRDRKNKMASEQPLKKKLRRGNNSNSTDETDFIHNLAESGVGNDLSALHLSFPANVNEDDITLNTVNSQFHRGKSVFRTSELSESDQKCMEDKTQDEKEDYPTTSCYTSSHITTCENISMQPAPDIMVSSFVAPLICSNFDRNQQEETDESNKHQMIIDTDEEETETFYSYLVKQCLCEIPDSILRKPFEGHQIIDENGSRLAILSEWSTSQVLQFLSNVQLLFDVYLKQNNNGHICSKIVTICNTFVHNEHNLIEQILSLCETRDKYVNYLAAKVFSSFFDHC
jgi:hypothetical protein